MEIKDCSKQSFKNRGKLEVSTNAGCFYCCRIYPATEIREWTDDGTTPLCPSCGIDSVLGDVQTELTKSILAQMHDYAFEG